MVAIAHLLSFIVGLMPFVLIIALFYLMFGNVRFPRGSSETQSYLITLAILYGPMSVYAFIAMGTDKLIAVLNRKKDTGIMRIPERYLHLFEYACGWPGSLIAQRVFRHKVSKYIYQLEFWPIVVFHICYLVGDYATEHGHRRTVLLCWIVAILACIPIMLANVQRYGEALDKAEDEKGQREWEASKAERAQAEADRYVDDWIEEQKDLYGEDTSKWDEARQEQLRKMLEIRDQYNNK